MKNLALLMLFLVFFMQGCSSRFKSEVKATGERPFLALSYISETSTTDAPLFLLSSESPDLCSIGQGTATLLFRYEDSWEEATMGSSEVECSGVLIATVDDLAEIFSGSESFNNPQFDPKMVFPLIVDLQGRLSIPGESGEAAYYVAGDEEYIQIVQGLYTEGKADEIEHLYSVPVRDGRPMVQTERHMVRGIAL